MKRRLAALVALPFLLLVVAARPVAAHEGDGMLAVETQEATAAGARFVVRLAWANDGHPAVDATVTATPIARGGQPGTPVPLAEVGEGRYEAEVPLPAPGTWTVRLTAVTPSATLEVTYEVPATTTTAAPAAPTTGPSISRPDEAGGTPATNERAASPASDDGGIGVTGAISIVVLTLIVGGSVVGFSRSVRRLKEPT